MRCLISVALLIQCSTAADRVMMYKARGTECGQAFLQKSWVIYAKRFAGLDVGDCPGKGYTVATKSMHMKVPVLGTEVPVQMYRRQQIQHDGLHLRHTRIASPEHFAPSDHSLARAAFKRHHHHAWWHHSQRHAGPGFCGLLHRPWLRLPHILGLGA